MKKLYEVPEMEIERFQFADILTTSDLATGGAEDYSDEMDD